VNALAVLTQVPLLSDVPLDGLQRLSLLCRQRTFKAGDALMRQGEVSQYMYILTEGHVRVERNGDRGLALVLAELGPGDVVGEMGLLDREPRSATVLALEDTVVVELGAAALALTLLQFPEVTLALLRIVSQRLRSTDELAQEMRRVGRN
jgi:CRP/FNR family cyclic AMP-dependent transcriptional regulator